MSAVVNKKRSADISTLSSKQLGQVADFLRAAVTAHDAISIERRVEIFSGKEAVSAILGSSSSDVKGKKFPLNLNLSSPEHAKHLLLMLLKNGYFIKAMINGTKEIPLTPMQQAMLRAETMSGNQASSGVQLPKPEVIYLVSPDPSVSWSDDIKFIWIYEGSKLFSILLSFGILIFAFFIIMYPLWPYQLRLGAWYLMVFCIILVGLLALLSVVRLGLYVLSLVAGLPGFWLFPNLYEDCGFFESFVPLYGWDMPPQTKGKQQ